MPIQCLTSIRFSFDQECLCLPIDPCMETIVAGVYQFDLTSLGPEVALFNDGFPALIILPNRNLKSTCRIQGEFLDLDAIWFAAGAINQSYWQPPTAAENEKLTIVRFFPSAWQALFGKQANVQPYIHNLADYHAGLAAVFQQIYEGSSLIESLIDLLMDLFAQLTIDRDRLAFDQIAFHLDRNDNDGNENATGLANFHPKWVQRQFKRSMGMSPYQFEQLKRFIGAYECLQKDVAPNLHAVADACGYYDANHLVKDFNKYLGMSPRHYFKASAQQ